MIGAYFVVLVRRIDPRPEDNPDGNIEEGAGDQGVYSPWSWWPLAIAAAAATVFLGLAIGWWMVYVGSALGMVALVGWVFEFSRGQHAHWPRPQRRRRPSRSGGAPSRPDPVPRPGDRQDRRVTTPDAVVVVPADRASRRTRDRLRSRTRPPLLVPAVGGPGDLRGHAGRGARAPAARPGRLREPAAGSTAAWWPTGTASRSAGAPSSPTGLRGLLRVPACRGRAAARTGTTRASGR